MSAFAARFLDSLPPIEGFILKGGSPTSGTRNVRVYPSTEKSAAIAKSAGFFAREVLKRYPELPVEDELRLNNQRIRDHFLSTVFTLAAFRGVERTRDPQALVQFHANNKLLLLASSQKMLREMGQLVAARAEIGPGELFLRYRRMLSIALGRAPRYTSNVNVLLHTLGYFSDRISGEERAHCIRLIDRYRDGHATLGEPRGLLRSWVIRFQEPYLMNQSFFAPYPAELVDLPGDVTDRGRDVWNSREVPSL